MWIWFLENILPYIGSIILYIGMFFIIRKSTVGWLFRLLSHITFVAYCVFIIPSIHLAVLYIVDAIFDIIGFYKWKKK